MCITSYPGFKRMIAFCQTRVPKEVDEAIEKVKDDTNQLRAYAIDFGTQMCKDLIESGAPGLHFYTLK